MPVEHSILQINNATQFTDITGASVPLEEISVDQNPWADSLRTAISLAETPRNRDKAIKTASTALAQYAISLEGEVYNPKKESLYTSIFQKINQEAKKKEIQTTPEYAATVYTQIIPILLKANTISTTFANEEGHNSVDQIVSTALQILDAPNKNGTFRIFSQQCAQYNSGSTHDASSFGRGLAEDIHLSEVQRALEPIAKIAQAMQNHGINVEIVTPQVAPQPEMLFALVPAAVWEYVEKGQTADMLHLLHKHTERFNEHATTLLPDVPFVSTSYTELRDQNELSIVDRTLHICNQFGQLLNLTNDTDKSWRDFQAHDIQQLIRHIDNEGHTESIVDKAAKLYNWTPEDKRIIETLIINMASTNGVLEDTVKFYSREHIRRSAAAAVDWERTVDIDNETNALVNNAAFLPDHEPQVREKHAQELLKHVSYIANIGIGSRAIFNAALYTSLALYLVDINSNGESAIMWPIEEDVDRWALNIMQRTWNALKGSSVIPCIYPAKTLRQPFNRE